MAKIPFSIEHREKIESGEYKVETRSGKTARVVFWDRVGTQLIVLVGKDEDVLTYNPDGTTGQQMQLPSDLFIVTPEPELTEFEKAFDNLAESYHSDNNPDDVACCKEYAAKLLSLAREQLQPEINAEIEKAYKNADEVQYEKGKADALKGLPRWKKAALAFGNYTVAPTETGEYCLLIDGYFIMLSDLEKLPKEDEDE